MSLTDASHFRLQDLAKGSSLYGNSPATDLSDASLIHYDIMAWKHFMDYWLWKKSFGDFFVVNLNKQ